MLSKPPCAESFISITYFVLNKQVTRIFAFEYCSPVVLSLYSQVILSLSWSQFFPVYFHSKFVQLLLKILLKSACNLPIIVQFPFWFFLSYSASSILSLENSTLTLMLISRSPSKKPFTLDSTKYQANYAFSVLLPLSGTAQYSHGKLEVRQAIEFQVWFPYYLFTYCPRPVFLIPTTTTAHEKLS